MPSWKNSSKCSYFLCFLSPFPSVSFSHSTRVRLRGERSRRHNYSSSSSSSRCSLSLISFSAGVVVVVVCLFVWYMLCCCYYSCHTSSYSLPVAQLTWPLSFVTLAYIASPRHTRQLRAVALSPREVTRYVHLWLHTAAGSCERRTGLNLVQKTRADVYLYIPLMIPPASLWLACGWPFRRRKTYFNQVKPHATRTDGRSK